MYLFYTNEGIEMINNSASQRHFKWTTIRDMEKCSSKHALGNLRMEMRRKGEGLIASEREEKKIDT